jgi:hypothetical protein
MIQYGLDFHLHVKGFFTLEKFLINKTLNEIEGLLGYHRGRLKQGADIYLLSPPNNPGDFERFGTSVFPGHKFDGSNLQKAINSDGKKEEDLSVFRRKRIIKVVPLQIHIEAMAKYLSPEDYQLIREVNAYGKSEQELIREITHRYRNNATLIQEVKRNFALAKEVYQKNEQVNDELYPSAYGGSVPQWRLNVLLPGRCVCRMTDYYIDRYQKIF